MKYGYFLCSQVMIASLGIVLLTLGAYAMDMPPARDAPTAERTPEDLERMHARNQIVIKADKLRQEGKNKEATVLYQQAIRDYKDANRSSAPLAETLMDQGRYNEAVEVYRTFVYEYPNKGWSSSRSKDVDVLMRFVFALSVTGNKGEAWEVFQSTTDRIPTE